MIKEIKIKKKKLNKIQRMNWNKKKKKKKTSHRMTTKPRLSKENSLFLGNTFDGYQA